MKNTILALLVVLALPSAGWASSWLTGKTVSDGGLAIFSFALSDGTSDDAARFVVKDRTATFCFVPDTAGAPAGTARVQPRFLPRGSETVADSIPAGGANGNANLDGTGGPSTTQNACMRIGTGQWAIDIDAACGAGDACLVTIQGEGGR